MNLRPAIFTGTDRFAVISRLGRGGMGTVYHVADRVRGTRVALKSVGGVVGDELLRFKHEFRALQGIDHPNLVTLGELFEHHGQWFFTMELIQGEDFLQHVRLDHPGASPPSHSRASAAAPTRAALTPVAAAFDATLGADEAAQAMALGLTMPGAPGPLVVRDLAAEQAVEQSERQLDAHPLADPSVGFDEVRLRQALAQLCEGLHALHSAGQIHRDIKPANVMVEDSGRVVLIDFGLAVSVHAADDTTLLRFAGTPAYMAPEQVSEAVLGPAADWYAVGVTLYEALTGQLPFKGTLLAIALQKQTQLPPSPAEVVEGVPADLDALCMDLLSIRPEQRPTGHQVLARLAVDVQNRPLSSRSRPSTGSEEFIGRAEELERLRRELDRSRRGSQAVVVLTGASGIGKSSLLARFIAAQRRENESLVVLRGRCYEQEAMPFNAFDGVMDQLSRWLRKRPPEELDAILPEHVALLGRVFPVLRRVARIDEQRLPARPDQLELKRLVLAALRALFLRIRERYPLLITIDDAQWSDDESRRLFDALTRPPAPPALMLLLAERTDEGEGRSKVAEWFQSARRLNVGPLSAEESMALARKHLSRAEGDEPDDARLVQLVEHARGHPIFLEALLRRTSEGAAASGPPELSEVLREQIATLDEPTRRLLEIVCVAGSPLEQTTAAEAAHVEPSILPQRMRTLRVARLLRTSDLQAADAVEPYHARIREAVLGALAPGPRRAHHRSLARTLEQHNAGPAQIAIHHEAGGQPERATTYYLEGARRAMQALAFDPAAELLSRALRLGALEPDAVPGVQIELGHALANAGRGAEAAEAYAAGLEGASPAQRLDLKRRIAEQLLTAGLYQEGVAAGRDALAELGIKVPRSAGAAFRQLVWLRMRIALRGLSFEPAAEDELSAHQLAQVDACWALSRGFAAHDIILAQVLQSRALLLALRAGEKVRVARGLAYEYISRVIDGPKAIAKQHKLLDQAREIARETGDPRVEAAIAFGEGMGTHTAACDFKAAAPLFKEANRIHRMRCSDVAWETELTDEQRLIALFWLGRWGEMARELPELCKHAESIGNLYWVNRFYGSYASFAAELEGDVEESRRLIALGEAALPEDPSGVQTFGQLWCANRLDLYEGRWREAIARHEGWKKDLLASFVLKVPLVALTHAYDAARIYLLAAQRDPEGRARHAKLALKAARRLEKLPIPWGASLADAIRAGLACLAGREDDALRLLEGALPALDAAGITGIATAVRRRRGQLLGEDSEEGRRLLATSERWCLDQGVHDAEAMMGMLLPG